MWGIDGALFAVGQRGLVIRWDGGRWVESPAGANADQDFVSVGDRGRSHIVAVGGRSNGRVATWDGSAWTTLAPTGLGGLNAVAMSRPDEAVIGGIRLGRALHAVDGRGRARGDADAARRARALG